MRSNMRPETLSLPTRESRLVGGDIAAMARGFLSPAAPPPVFPCSPPQATRSRRMPKIKRRMRKNSFFRGQGAGGGAQAFGRPIWRHFVCALRPAPCDLDCMMQVMVQRLLLACALLMPVAAHAQQKVIVLGFDGVDARYTEQWMNEGKLPNLAKLRAAGTFRPQRPIVPAQTPVSWSTFSTGIDPGRTGIFDFLRRDPKNYLPVFAAFDETKEPFAFGEKNPMIFGAIAFGVLAIIALLIMMRWRVAGVTLLAIAVAAGAGVFYATQKLIPTRIDSLD